MQTETVKNEFGVLPVPLELLCEAGITPMTLIQYSVREGKLIIEAADTGDYVCDGDCEDCPAFDEVRGECWADDKYPDDSEDDEFGEDDKPVSLPEFLDCLSESEQKEAYRYLSVKLTKMKGCDERA